MGARREARIAAFQAVYAWEDSQPVIEELCQFQWVAGKLPASDFASLVVNGTIENIHQIDLMINKHLKNWSFDRLNKVDLAVMRISVYSIIHQKDIPDLVTINEAIEIAKKFGSGKSYCFVNGILDSIRNSLSNDKI